MKENYLKRHIEAFFTESTAIEANLKIIETFMAERSKQLKKEFPFPNYTLYSMITCYRDLSQLRGGDNLYDTGNSYNLTTDNLDSETIRLLSNVSCLTLSQVFEVFESFLKNILAESVFKNLNLVNVLKIDGPVTSFEEIRSTIKIIQGSNNKGFIKALKKLSPYFKTHANKNIWNRNMGLWFNLISEIRHTVVHKRQTVDSSFLNFIKISGATNLFNEYFTISNNTLSLTPYNASEVISNLFEYAHLIYKGLSADLLLNIDVDFKCAI